MHVTTHMGVSYKLGWYSSTNMAPDQFIFGRFIHSTFKTIATIQT